MKLLDEIKDIINQYNLTPLILPDGYKNVYQYINDNPKALDEFKSEISDSELYLKYKKYIPKGWYGFDIGQPIISSWSVIIDKILEICVINDNDFEIHQIKLKFGGIRFYVQSNAIEDIFEIDDYIENNLYDEALIY